MRADRRARAPLVAPITAPREISRGSGCCVEKGRRRAVVFRATDVVPSGGHVRPLPSVGLSDSGQGKRIRLVGHYLRTLCASWAV